MMRTRIVVALLLFLVATNVVGKPSRGLPFINDNFERALAEGKQRNLPIFVEVWAPW